MKKTKISKHLTFIALLSFLAIFTYIIQTSYGKLVNPVSQVKKDNTLKPIDPNFDQDTLRQIEARQEFLHQEFVKPALTATPSSSSSPLL